MYKKILKIPINVIKKIWNLLNFTRQLILNLFIIMLIINLFIQIYNLRGNNNNNILKKKALIINIKGSIEDFPPTYNKCKYIPLYKKIFKFSQNTPKEISLFDIIYALRQAKDDEQISGVILNLKHFISTNYTSLEYIGKALCEFKSSGKPIYAISNKYNQMQYFLASYANKIFLNPYGEVRINGISINNWYYKSFLEKLKINCHVFYVGKYKSAIEPLTRNNMSEETKKINNYYINTIWKRYAENIFNNRKNIHYEIFFKNDIQEILNRIQNVHGDNTQLAINTNLVDQISSNYEFEKEMIKIFGWDENKKTFNKINLNKYNINDIQNTKNKIAVIIINGTLGPEIQRKSVNEKQIIKQISNIRHNTDIKGLIVRINSPGGIVQISEDIRSELQSIKDQGKPIVISMGGIAASGGYWISTIADKIVASPNTITGSIGVFGVINTYERIANFLGIYNDGVRTSQILNTSPIQNIPENLSKIIQLNIENIYQKFITLVANARHKTIKEINKISQGKIFIGSDALRNGLVDVLGDFDDAVEQIVKLSNLNEYYIQWQSNKESFIDFISTKINNYLNNNHLHLINLFGKITYQNIIHDDYHNLIHINTDHYNNLYDKNYYSLCLIGNIQL